MIKGALGSRASPFLFSIHPEAGDRIGEGYLLFRRCAEND